MPPQSALSGGEGTIMGLGQKETRAEKSAKAGNTSSTAELMTEAERNMTTEEWKTVFERYQKDIDFVKKGIDKGRFEDAIKDLDELLANIVYDTKLSGHAVVVAFFKLNSELMHLHREIKVEGYAASEQFWWQSCDKGKSLFIFEPESKVRILCGKIATNPTFDQFILFLILVGTICLALDSPEYCTQSWCNALPVIDLVINIIFTIEMIARIIYMGFYCGKNAYLQDGWLTMDFIVVVTGWLSMMDGFPNFKPFRAFKALKTMKAVRLLSYCAAVLDALVAGLPLFVDVFLVTGFLLTIFGIMGTQLFKSSMHRRCQLIGSTENSNDDILQIGAGAEAYCGGDLYGGKFKRDSDDPCCTNGVCAPCKLYSDDGHTCPRGFYCHVVGSSDQLANDGWTRFDNLGIAMFTLFEMMTLEGWTEIMYACQYADSPASSWYFVMVILLFSFIMVNLYIAVIVQTFAKIRKIRDDEAIIEKEQKAIEMARVEEEMRLEEENRKLSVAASNPLATVGIAKPDFGTVEMSPSDQILRFLQSLNLEVYFESVMRLVSTVDELYLVTEEDLLSEGWRLVHIRRLKDAVLAPPVFQSNASFHGVQDWDPMSPQAKSPSEEMYAFLHGYKLSQYHPVLIKLVDNLDELSKLTVEDFENHGLKLVHARQLEEALIDRAIARPQANEDLLNPALIEVLGGESVGMWRARWQRGSKFWKSCLGSMLLSIWYREDPMIDWNDPSPSSLPRTKFVEPYRWTGKIGELIATDAFEGVIAVAIILNIVFMALDYNKAPDGYRNMIKAMEFVFFCVFLGEMMLKFKGMGGLKWYFAVPFNQFDFVLVMASWPSAIAFLAGTEPFINLSMLRVFRLFRMFKLIESMRQLLEVVASAGKAIGNLILFIFFFVLIFAIFGMQMFSQKVKNAEGEVPRANFQGTGDALLALFQTMTGEDWTGIMWDVMRDNAAMGMVFFIIFYIMANYILMEMFCAVILENFQLTTEEKDALQLQLYQVQLKKQEAAKALADSVDKELAAQMKEEMEKKEKAEAEARMRKIREQNEGTAPVEMPTEKVSAEPDQPVEPAPEPEAPKSIAEEELTDGPKVKEKKNAMPPSAIVEKTCFVFDQEHPFRQKMYAIEQTKAFEWSVFFAILLGCVFLALDTPYKPNPEAITMITIGSPIILAIYNFEFVVKVVSKGFIGKPSAYIMDPWNRVDFAVLVLSDISMFFVLIGLATVLPSSLIMAIRTLRVIRPLRLINQNERIQIVFNALFMSLPAILNVMTLLIFCIFMFSILGMGLYMGLFYSCNFEVANEWECRGITHTADGLDYPVPSRWANPRYDFDNVFNGMLVLFESSTLEGWVDVMHSCQDINGEPGGDDNPAKQPEKDKEVMQALFIVAYICFGCFFVLNLVMGVMIEKFNQISGRGILTDDQKMYKDSILQAQLHDDRQPLGRPPGAVRGWCYSFCMHPNFEGCVLFLICVNAAFMATEHYNQSNSWTTFLYTMNLVLSLVFTVEITIRLIAIYPKQFFADPWNVMDFLIVLCSLIMIPLDGVVNLTALRPFRLLLLFRMIKRAKGIRLMICTLLLSLPALFNVTCLLFLAYFIFAILGMSWWSNIKFNESINAQAHFRTFPDALLMLARITTGEGWNSMLRDCFVINPDCTDFYGATTDGWGDLSNTIDDIHWGSAPNGGEYWLPNDCGNPAYSVIFYILFTIVGAFCVINLFVAVILDNYAFMANVGDAEINEFVLDKFKKTWYRYTLADKHAGKHLGRYLRVNQLRSFIGDLGAPLGIVVWDSEGTKKYKMIKEEVRNRQTAGQGIDYRKMQMILCDVTMGTHVMPYEDKVKRQKYLDDLATAKAAVVIQAMYKGKKARQGLGVKKGAAVSEADAKAKDFKKRFMSMLADPSAVKKPVSVPAPVAPTATSPAAATAGNPAAALPAPAAVGVAPTSPAPQGSLEASAQETNNIFQQRAAERARAKAAKSGK